MLGSEAFVDDFDEILARTDNIRSDSLAGVVKERRATALEANPGSNHVFHVVSVEFDLLVAKSNC